MLLSTAISFRVANTPIPLCLAPPAAYDRVQITPRTSSLSFLPLSVLSFFSLSSFPPLRADKPATACPHAALLFRAKNEQSRNIPYDRSHFSPRIGRDTTVNRNLLRAATTCAIAACPKTDDQQPGKYAFSPYQRPAAVSNGIPTCHLIH